MLGLTCFPIVLRGFVPVLFQQLFHLPYRTCFQQAQLESACACQKIDINTHASSFVKLYFSEVTHIVAILYSCHLLPNVGHISKRSLRCNGVHQNKALSVFHIQVAHRCELVLHTNQPNLHVFTVHHCVITTCAYECINMHAAYMVRCSILRVFIEEGKWFYSIKKGCLPALQCPRFQAYTELHPLQLAE